MKIYDSDTAINYCSIRTESRVAPPSHQILLRYPQKMCAERISRNQLDNIYCIENEKRKKNLKYISRSRDNTRPYIGRAKPAKKNVFPPANKIIFSINRRKIPVFRRVRNGIRRYGFSPAKRPLTRARRKISSPYFGTPDLR